jgi:hypothetical protein
MSTRAIPSCAIAVLLALASISLLNRAEEPAKQKTWIFQGQSGTVKIRASEYDGDADHKVSTTLELWVENGRSGIEEEGRFISFALAECPKSGFDISSISMLLFRLDQTNSEKQIAPFAAKSGKWNSVARANSAAITYPVVTAMLNDSGLFHEWFEIFQARGLEGNIAGIEKLGMTTYRATGATCPTKLNCGRVLVPTTALVQLNLHSARKD